MFDAIGQGFRRLLEERGVVFLVWALGLLLALPAAWQVIGSIDASARDHVAAENLGAGFDMPWYGEFHDTARGVERTFTPSMTGAGAFYAGFETWLRGTFLSLPPLLLGLGVLYLLAWLLLQGGIVARLVHRGPGPGPEVLTTGARFFWRFTRLFALSGVLYALLYLGSRRVYRWLGTATRDVTSETTVLWASLLVLGITAALLVFVQLGASYARIATVREDRRAMLRALVAGLGFALRHAVATGGLALFLAALATVLLIAYAAVAPVAGPTTWVGVTLALVGAEVHLVARMFLRLWLLSGQATLYARRAPAPGSRRAAPDPVGPLPAGPARA